MIHNPDPAPPPNDQVMQAYEPENKPQPAPARNPEPEARSAKPQIRNQEPETRNPKSKTRNQKLKPEAQNPKVQSPHQVLQASKAIVDAFAPTPLPAGRDVGGRGARRGMHPPEASSHPQVVPSALGSGTLEELQKSRGDTLGPEERGEPIKRKTWSHFATSGNSASSSGNSASSSRTLRTSSSRRLLTSSRQLLASSAAFQARTRPSPSKLTS